MLLIFRNQIPPKKNSRQLLKKKSGLVSIPSAKYEEWHKFIIDNIDNILYFVDIEGDKNQFFNKEHLHINATFFPNNNRKFDLTNVIQSVEDTLTDLKIIKDDSFNYLSSFQYFVDTDYKEEDIFLIVEISHFTKKDKQNLIHKFKNIYNIIKNKIYLNIPQFKTQKKAIQKKKKQKKSLLYYDPDID